MRVLNIRTAFVDEALVAAGLPYGSSNIANINTLRSLAGYSDRSHAKFLRQMQICCTVRAPMCWWTEFDTYKVGVTRMSTSTMNRLMKGDIDDGDFDNYTTSESIQAFLDSSSAILESGFSKSEKILRMKCALPGGFLYTSFVTMNYEALSAMYRDRINHRLHYWHLFLGSFESIPYYNDFICIARSTT